MFLGIFAKTFNRSTVGEVFDAVKSNQLKSLQFNFSCAGLPTLPEELDQALLEHIRFELVRRSLVMSAISGTCNLIHPDIAKRFKDRSHLETMIRLCPVFGNPVVTLCTGTRDPQDMWCPHPENGSPAAWQDLTTALERLLAVAQEVGVILGIEPEPANVINSAPAARKLLDELRSPFLKIVFDAANLLSSNTLPVQSRILQEAADLLGPDIVLAHAKDLSEGKGDGHVAAGRGSLDYSIYLSVLRKAGFGGPLVLHNLSEAEVPHAVKFLQSKLAKSHAVPHARQY